MKTITAKEVKQILENDEGAPVINVLPPEHHRKMHIPGSISIPMDEDSFVQRVGHVAKDKGHPVVVYCADESCNASPTAAKKLEDAGFEDVKDFEGGVKAWTEAGFPLEGEAVKA